MKSLKQQLQEALKLPDDNFSDYHSDLYVKYTPETYKWLGENYEFFSSVEIFQSAIEGEGRWIEIPFANQSKGVLI